MTEYEYYNNKSKEELISIIFQQDEVIRMNKAKVFLLSGCHSYGEYADNDTACLVCREASGSKYCNDCRQFAEKFKNFYKVES